MALVSICIPTFKPEFFELALRSAQAQSYQDIEIVVSDDCPTEAIREICERSGATIRYSRNPRPGLESNVRRLVEIASGVYIKFLFDDDVLHPFCVQYLVETLERTAHQNTRMAFSPRHFIDATNHMSAAVNPFNVSNAIKVVPGAEFIRMTAINHRNTIGEFTTVLFRREDCFLADGTFRLFTLIDYEYDGLSDLSAFFELACLGNFAIHPQPLSYFRRHENTTSNHLTNPKFIVAVTYYETLLNQAFDRGYLPASDLPQAYRNLLDLYRSWVGFYPELGARIDQISAAMPQPN